MKQIILSALLLAGCATPSDVARTGPWTDFYNDPRDSGIPADVRKFVINAQGCGHFSGEVDDNNDTERKAYIEKVMNEMCPGISTKQKELLTKYPNNAAAQAIIAEVTEGYSFD